MTRRSVIVTDGAVAFLGVHDPQTNEIELIGYWEDPGYWSMVAKD
jgi:hypothetical protein